MTSTPLSEKDDKTEEQTPAEVVPTAGYTRTTKEQLRAVSDALDFG